MEIDIRTEGRAAVLVLNGRLVQGERLELLRERVNTLMSEGYRELVIDLKSVSYVDSAGLGELVAIHTSVQREGTVSIRVVGLNRRLADLIAASAWLRNIFDVDPGMAADPINPRLTDLGWPVQLGVALAILVIILVLIALR